MRRRRPGRGNDRPAGLSGAGEATATIAVRLQPRAGREEIAGERDGRLLVRVNAPPVEGKANEALCRLIAKRAGVALGAVSIARGERSRDKTVRVEGLDAAELRARLVSGKAAKTEPG